MAEMKIPHEIEALDRDVSVAVQFQAPGKDLREKLDAIQEAVATEETPLRLLAIDASEEAVT